MNTKRRYWLIIGVFVAGLLLGAVLVLVFRPAPPGWGPIKYPKADWSEWNTYARYTGAEGDAVENWYRGALGDGGTTWTECDGKRCHIVTGMLNGQWVDAQIIVDDTEVVVTQKPTEDPAVIEFYSRRDSPRPLDYIFAVAAVIGFVVSGLTALGLVRLTGAVQKEHPLNRKLGISNMLLWIGLLIMNLGDWVRLHSGVSIFVFVLGFALVLGNIYLQSRTNAEIRAYKQAIEKE